MPYIALLGDVAELAELEFPSFGQIADGGTESAGVACSALSGGASVGLGPSVHQPSEESSSQALQGRAGRNDNPNKSMLVSLCRSLWPVN